jgi:hypothetical protein
MSNVLSNQLLDRSDTLGFSRQTHNSMDLLLLRVVDYTSRHFLVEPISKVRIAANSHNLWIEVLKSTTDGICSRPVLACTNHALNLKLQGPDARLGWLCRHNRHSEHSTITLTVRSRLRPLSFRSLWVDYGTRKTEKLLQSMTYRSGFCRTYYLFVFVY